MTEKYVLPQKFPAWLWWLIGTVVLLMFINTVSGILMPFLVGLTVAYLLDPWADKLEALHVPRGLATAIVLLGFILCLVGIGFIIAPILQDQVGGIIKNLPSYIEHVRPFVYKLLRKASNASQARDILSEAGTKAAGFLSSEVGTVLSKGFALVNTLTLVVISPVVAFYMLRDWDIMVAKLETLLPQDSKASVISLLLECDVALSGFVRGQTLVCLAMGVLYAIGWSIIGLQYGFLLGVLIGVLAFVPTAGPTIGLAIAMIVAIGQWGGTNNGHIALVFLVFVIVQLLENAILTPKLIGEKVGLHPVWVLFSIFAGGEILGFVGIFIAVPAAAVIAVLTRYAVKRYLASRTFSGS